MPNKNKVRDKTQEHWLSSSVSIGTRGIITQPVISTNDPPRGHTGREAKTKLDRWAQRSAWMVGVLSITHVAEGLLTTAGLNIRDCPIARG